jgi:hypothetical protein
VKAAKSRPSLPFVRRAAPGAPSMQFRFRDGSVYDTDVEDMATRLEAMRPDALRSALRSAYYRWRGEQGGRPTKPELDEKTRTPEEVNNEILLRFGERLFAVEGYADQHWREAQRAWNRARAWTVNSVKRTYNVKVRTAQRYVDRALGERKKNVDRALGPHKK